MIFIRYTEVLPDDNPDEIGIETIQMMLMTKFHDDRSCGRDYDSRGAEIR